MRLTRLAGGLAVARVEPHDPVPEELLRAPGFVSFTRTAEEISIVAGEALLADMPKVEPGWTAFRVEGPLDFALTGILAELSGALAAADISLFAISTYDTDYILVRATDADRAAETWREAGHDV